MEKTLKDFFEKHNIRYEIFHHPPVFKVEDSKKIEQIKKIPGIRTKSLFLKSNSNFYLVTLRGEKRLNMRFLKKHFNIKELKFASPEEMKKEINLTPGSVSPCGLIYSKNTFFVLDSELWNAEKIGFHPNNNNATIVLSHSELEKFYNSLQCNKEILSLE